MPTIIINKYREEVPEDAIDCMRSGQLGLGNPFIIGKDGDRNEVCDKFESWCADKIANDAVYRRKVKSLKGKVLVCCCVPARCHCETLRRWTIKLNRERDDV